ARGWPCVFPPAATACDLGLPSAGPQSAGFFDSFVGCQLLFSSITDKGNEDGLAPGNDASPGLMTARGSCGCSMPIGRIGGSCSVVSGTITGVGVMAGSTIGGGGAIVGVGV